MVCVMHCDVIEIPPLTNWRYLLCRHVRKCYRQTGLTKGAETKEASWSGDISTDSMLKMCFSYMKPILHRAFHSLDGELMNCRSRYTAESKAFVCIIRKCAPFPEGNSSKLNLNQKIPRQNCLGIALSFSFLSPCSVNNPTKAWV